jgi:hypothetical protein
MMLEWRQNAELQKISEESKKQQNNFAKKIFFNKYGWPNYTANYKSHKQNNIFQHIIHYGQFLPFSA